MDYEFTVEKGVYMPPAPPSAKRPRSKYPFADMEVGDSFGFPASIIGRVMSAAYHYRTFANGGHGKAFEIRADGDGFRIWRTT